MAILNVRIPDELNNVLSTSAKNQDRSKGYIVRRALEYYLHELQSDFNDAEIALQRINKKERKFITSEELDKIING